MIRLALALLALMWPVILRAEPVTVRAGEHGAFTRLVLGLPAGSGGWQVARTDTGYGVMLAGTDDGYDLSTVYNLIGRDRLRSIWADPESRTLMLGIGCACHIIPFEFGPRALVLDIRDGPPPAGSAFELSMSGGTALPALRAHDQPRPRSRPEPASAAATGRGPSGEYDWLADSMPRSATAPSTSPLPDLQAEAEHGEFRGMLVEALGRGATSGAVDMQLAPSGGQDRTFPSAAPTPETPQARVRLDDNPGLIVSLPGAPPPDLMADGGVCPAPAALDIAGWVDGTDPARALAAARAALVGEFDIPDSGGVSRAIRTHLYFGFGAEARQLIDQFAPAAEDSTHMRALSHLVDGEAVTENPFHNMQSCDSAAALWAALAAPANAPLPGLNGSAATRSYLTLPPPLRADLGAGLSLRLLQAGDSANAEVVRHDLSRTLPPDSPGSELLAVQTALATNRPDEAEALLARIEPGAGGAEALLARAETRFRRMQPLDPADLLALEAFGFEAANGPQAETYSRAVARARALGGDFTTAFQLAETDATLATDIWSILAETGGDSVLLPHAVGAGPTTMAGRPAALRAQIAERLSAAGLPNAALAWLPSDHTPPELAARIHLANNDARTALRILSADLDRADPSLIAAAFTDLGAVAQAIPALRQAGQERKAAQLEPQLGDWAALAATEGPWGSLANTLASQVQPDIPPLQAGHALLGRSNDTLAAINVLLGAVPAVSMR